MHYLPLLGLLTATACATLTAEGDQSIQLITEPAGAACRMANGESVAAIDKTPGFATVKRDYSPLRIQCSLNGKSVAATIQPQTRDRAYGNLLLLGFPGAVDAATGYAYEYPDEPVRLVFGK